MPRSISQSGGPDIVVAGAGVVGLVVAIALAQAGYAVACVGPVPPDSKGRTVALLEGSVRYLAALGLWARAAPVAAPLATMRIVDDTGSLFRGPPVDFVAAELGLPAFGFNIANAALVGVLEAAAAATPGLTRHTALIAGHTAEPDGVRVALAGGGTLCARLLVAADGARSGLREAAGIGNRQHRYPQVALTAVLAHTKPHGDISTEFHTRQGPFTLVPLVEDDGAAHRSSLVWVMTQAEAERRLALAPADLAAEIERQSRVLLGGVRLMGPVGRFPIASLVADRLVGPRLALAGEAAHALPPIGAQGLNLSLRDAAALAEILGAARAQGRDPGAPATLAAYETARRGDITLRAAAVDALNRSLLSAHLPVDLARGAGLAALRAVRPLRRAVMRQGLSPDAHGPGLTTRDRSAIKPASRRT